MQLVKITTRALKIGVHLRFNPRFTVEFEQFDQKNLFCLGCQRGPKQILNSKRKAGFASIELFFLQIFYCPCLVSFCLATAPHGLLILPLLTITLQLLPFCQLRLYTTLAVVMPPALMGSTSTTSTSSPSTKIRLATIKFYSPNATHT